MDSMELASRLGRAEGEARAKGSALAAAEAEGQALRQQLQVRRGGSREGRRGRHTAFSDCLPIRDGCCLARVNASTYIHTIPL